MGFELNKTYHGFKLIDEGKVEEINSIKRIFLHEKSGAKLLSLQNDDDNKVFAAGFRTPPPNSTGLPHILEHSVLCGSRKFPTKEPFVDLLKGSLNTFLNAMTFPDKTMYPVASKNEKDFRNLMDVYLDAVYYPNIYKYPEILMQEGWHYEIENRDDDITYKGVVYNEMKGAFSSPEETLFRKIQESLFPDTSYCMESGGDPEVIPKLSYEQFIGFHKKYYHPSNSYLFLYGDGNLDDELKFIDENYLKDFDRIDVDSKIKYQKPFNAQKTIVSEYPISMDEEEKDNTFLSLNFACGKCIEPEVYLGLEILENMLLETPAAPLKKALLEAGIGKDVFGRFDNGILQPMLSIVVKNSNEAEKEKFQEIIFKTLEELVANGIDKKLIEASINSIEFKLREADFHGFPKGLLYYIKAMESWLYDENPTMHLEYNGTLSKIKTALSTDYFERMIKEYILNNNHRTLLVVKPKKGLGEEKSKELKEKLSDFKKGLSTEEIDKLIESTLNLKKRQSTPDLPEDVEKIPMVSIEDINPKAEVISTEERDENGVKVIFHPEFTNGIAYTNLYFSTKAVPQELLPYLGLMAGVLGKIGTDKFGYGELSNEVNINTGGIEFLADAFPKKFNSKEYDPKFIVKSKALVDKVPKLYDIIGEIIGSTVFDDKNRLKDIIREMKSRLEMVIYGRGHIAAGSHVLSYFSPSGKYNEIIKGLDFYRFVASLEKNYDNMADEIVDNLKKVSRGLFNINNLIVGFTADNDDYTVNHENFRRIVEGLSSEKLSYVDYNFDLKSLNEGFLTQANVQYVAKGYNFIDLGYDYTGKLQVLKTILGLDYMWNEIRVKGGAYGAAGRFDRNGNMFSASYRDPNLKETIGVYSRTGDYIRSFNPDTREMTKYIIGTISEMDFPLTPSMKLEKALANYICKVTNEDMQRERDEVLSIKPQDIKKFADMADDLMKQNYICVIGNESKIKDNKELFNNLVKLFE